MIIKIISLRILLREHDKTMMYDNIIIIFAQRKPFSLCVSACLSLFLLWGAPQSSSLLHNVTCDDGDAFCFYTILQYFHNCARTHNIVPVMSHDIIFFVPARCGLGYVRDTSGDRADFSRTAAKVNIRISNPFRRFMHRTLYYYYNNIPVYILCTFCSPRMYAQYNNNNNSRPYAYVECHLNVFFRNSLANKTYGARSIVHCARVFP